MDTEVYKASRLILGIIAAMFPIVPIAAIA